jgi:hypothetical protein
MRCCSRQDHAGNRKCTNNGHFHGKTLVGASCAKMRLPWNVTVRYDFCVITNQYIEELSQNESQRSVQDGG